MGNRIAEIKEAGCQDTTGWIVFQSTAMGCFTPIFTNELAARLFAATLPDILPNWDDINQVQLALDVNGFLRGALGEDPEAHQDYDEIINDDEREADLLAALRTHRARWAKEKAVKP